ncbi:MAG TPA: hypothetical protein V6D21_10640, partial [Candidatus Obscuribacterales bacterium]
LMPYPIQFESRRRNIQRFLKLDCLQIETLWFPLIEIILKDYEIIIVGDREFGSVKLAQWLCQQKVKFALRIKQKRYIQSDGEDYTRLSELGLLPGTGFYLRDVKVTKQKGFGKFNVAGYWKRKYRGKGEEEGRKGIQNYVGRLKEFRRSLRRHSSFWMGLYGQSWVIGMEFFKEIVNELMLIRRNKLPFFQRGLRAMSLILSTF